MRGYPSRIAMMSTIELVHYARFAGSVGAENEQAFPYVDGEIEGCAAGLRNGQIEWHERITILIGITKYGNECSEPMGLTLAVSRAKSRSEGRAKAVGVGCRVEPMVPHPAPPQTRTCAIHAYGSSSRASAAHARISLRHSPLACRGQGW